MAARDEREACRVNGQRRDAVQVSQHRMCALPCRQVRLVLITADGTQTRHNIKYPNVLVLVRGDEERHGGMRNYPIYLGSWRAI
jgi:hypothetical protein